MIFLQRFSFIAFLRVIPFYISFASAKKRLKLGCSCGSHFASVMLVKFTQGVRHGVSFPNLEMLHARNAYRFRI